MKDLNWKAVQKQCARVKTSHWVAIFLSVFMFLGVATAVSAYTYTVKQGDTLYSISRNSNMTLADLLANNSISNPNLIHVGQEINVPTESQAAPAQTDALLSHQPPAAPASSASAAPSSPQTAAPVPYANSATTYVVQRGDTMYRIAQRYGVSVAALSGANNIYNVNQIQVGQVLVIPAPNYQPPAYNQPLTVHPFNYSDPTAYIPSTLPDAPHTPATTETNPEIGVDYACTRFNLAQGRDSYRGSMEGLYIMKDETNGQIASWYAYTGELDSGWINNLSIAFNSVHITVIFIPAYGGGSPIQMQIVNPAGGTNVGWLTRGICHSVELQYPAGY